MIIIHKTAITFISKTMMWTAEVPGKR